MLVQKIGNIFLLTDRVLTLIFLLNNFILLISFVIFRPHPPNPTFGIYLLSVISIKCEYNANGMFY